MKKQHDDLRQRCMEHDERSQQLTALLNEKQLIIDDLLSEKR